MSNTGDSLVGTARELAETHDAQAAKEVLALNVQWHTATADTLRECADEIERLSERAALVDELREALRAVDDDWLSHRHPLESYPDDDKPPSLIEVAPETVKRVRAALSRADAARGEGG